MMTDPATLPDRISTLKKDFDDSFAQPSSEGVAAFENLLAIRVAGVRYALRLRDIRGLHVDRRITRLPSTFGGFLGVISLRGSFLPVYDLRALMGQATADIPRWLVVAACAPIALVFDSFDMHLRIAGSVIRTTDESPTKTAGRQAHVEEVVDIDGAHLPVLELASVCEHIRRHSPSTVAQS